MAKQKQSSSAVRASRATKATTKMSSGNLKEHNIQHLRLEIQGTDSLTSSSATNININDIIQTYLQERRNKLRSPYEDLSLEIQSHFDRTNACFDRMEDRLKSIHRRLD
ncbi:hypothetical protein KCU92_g7766, partial [Aureobasidium melanogenum]|jgi:hypothetical protein